MEGRTQPDERYIVQRRTVAPVNDVPVERVVGHHNGLSPFEQEKAVYFEHSFSQ